MGRAEEKYSTEREIESELIKLFAGNSGINLIYTSGQNIDRLVSIYNACKETKKTLAIDFYIANILETLSEFEEIPFPSKKYPEIKVFFPYRLSRMISNQGKERLLYRFKNFKITKGQIDNQFEKIVMVVRPSMRKDLELINNLNTGSFIYSLWEGFKKEKFTKDFIDFLDSKGMTQKHIHTSGHADVAALKRMVDVLKPKRLIPIHTFNREGFSELFSNVKIQFVNDNEIINID